MFPTIVSCSTLRIWPYSFYIEKIITQFKTTENNYRLPHLFSKKWRFSSMARSSGLEKAVNFWCTRANHVWNYSQWGCAVQYWGMTFSTNNLQQTKHNDFCLIRCFAKCLQSSKKQFLASWVIMNNKTL